MPYIVQDKRDVLDGVIDKLHHELAGLEADDPDNNMEGNLNYTITRLLHKVYGTSYREINDAVGMLNCVILEFYRKKAAPYEDQKEFENGAVRADNASIVMDEITVEDN